MELPFDISGLEYVNHRPFAVSALPTATAVQGCARLRSEVCTVTDDGILGPVNKVFHCPSSAVKHVWTHNEDSVPSLAAIFLLLTACGAFLVISILHGSDVLAKRFPDVLVQHVRGLPVLTLRGVLIVTICFSPSKPVSTQRFCCVNRTSMISLP